MDILDSHAELEEQMRECVEGVVEDAIKDGERRKRRVRRYFKRVEKMVNREIARRDASRRRTNRSRLFSRSSFRRKPSSKIEILLNPDTNDGFFFNIGQERMRNMAALDKAKELMHKQQILIALAHSAMVWDPERVFFHEGKIQGQLWTDGFKEEHIRKVEGDLWCVRMKWRAEEGCKWRPKTIHVCGKFGRQDAEQVNWVLPIRGNCSEAELDVEIFVFDDFYDDEEWGDPDEGRSLWGNDSEDEKY
ncbi:uncharacterized protein Triagg1_7304 [Trichoderma aggressivum f. europaeum]|uniref:Uncharacterized protein n=1 Tax=Trichoderma aggressivum f. europaeum TaxID=173218 RepID=A0AAE1M2V5_9HYPO|nr:hypothetical protein Triagg1_7304 [Trichoderma aggressivum f. europaeum]